MFNAPDGAFLGQYMPHMPSEDAQRKGLVDLPRRLQALSGNRSDLNSNGSVNQFLAGDLFISLGETSVQLGLSLSLFFHLISVQASLAAV